MFILPTRESTSSRLAELLGAGLGTGISALAANKMKQMRMQSEAKNFVNMGFSPDEASLLAKFSSNPEIQQKLLSSLWERGSMQQPMGMPAAAPEAQQFAPTQESSLIQALSGLPTQEMRQQPLSLVDQLKQQEAQRIFAGLSPEMQAALGLPMQQPSEMAMQMMPREQQAAEMVKQQMPQPRLVEQQKRTVADILRTPPLREQREERKLALAEQKVAQQEKAARFKETKAERKEILQKGRLAQERLQDLDRLQELEKEGKLDTPGYVEFLHRSGFDIPALMNPESEEFQKIAASFIRGAKEVFGARVTNYEMEQFLKTIPSLSQSPDGRNRVIANLKRLYRGDLEYNKAMKKVMQENKGVPPYDLSEQVDEEVGKKLDAITKQFKQDLKQPVPKGQNKLITALQAGAGALLGGKSGATSGLGDIAKMAAFAKFM